MAKSLCIESIYHSQVYTITKELNDQVNAFQERPQQETYPVLCIDALYEKNSLLNLIEQCYIIVRIFYRYNSCYKEMKQIERRWRYVRNTSNSKPSDCQTWIDHID